MAVGEGCLNCLATPPKRLGLDKSRPQWTRPIEGPRGSAMDQYWDLGMRKYLDRLAAEHDRGDAVAAVRGHDDKITAFRIRGIDDCLIGMLMLDSDHLASDAFFLRCVADGAKSFLGMLLHPCFVLSRRVLEHLRVGREYMKRQQDRQRGGFGADPFGGQGARHGELALGGVCARRDAEGSRRGGGFRTSNAAGMMNSQERAPSVNIAVRQP